MIQVVHYGNVLELSLVLDAEHLGQAAPALRPFDHGGRIVGAVTLAVEEAIELADRRQPPRHRGRREPALGESAEIGAQRVAVGGGDICSSGKIGEVAPVGIERIGAGAALGRKHVEEQLDQRFIVCARPAGHRRAAVSVRRLEQLVGRNRHGHLARLGIDKPA